MSDIKDEIISDTSSVTNNKIVSFTSKIMHFIQIISTNINREGKKPTEHAIIATRHI